MFCFCFPMTSGDFSFCGETLTALSSGGLWWEGRKTLVVSDLHLGKSQRIARRGGTLLPPYDSAETLSRLADDITALRPHSVVSLGDSFDDPQAISELGDSETQLRALMAGREWIWVEGNHDPGAVSLGGQTVSEISLPPFVFRHIGGDTAAEISGHWHPKASVSLRHRRITCSCFVMDQHRLVLPAYGSFTGGLSVHHPKMQALFATPPQVLLTRAPERIIPFEALCK